jgi:hypothetical protein
MTRIARPLALGAGTAAFGAVVYAGVGAVCRVARHATRAEAAAPLPGDELLPEPRESLTHAITIRRSAAEVWPWLVQMGGDRAGWYSYDVVDNGGRPSFDHLDPSLQELSVGSVLPSLPNSAEGFTVVDLEPERSLVLGLPCPFGGPPVLTWSFVLEEPEPGCTRLLTRARIGDDYEPPFGLPEWSVHSLVPWGHGVMHGKQLQGIRDRAERRALVRRFVPRAEHGGVHRTLVRAPASLVFDTACEMDPQSQPLVRSLFRLRARMMGARPDPRPLPSGLVAMTRRLGWGELARRPGRELVMGAVTRPWEADVTFRAVPADEFAEFAEPGLVKIAWSLEAEPLGPALTRFTTETRVVATDDAARERFERYWRRMGAGIVLTRVLLLPMLRREAERRFRAGVGA